eukprot:SAG11_NODE_6892_length_1230_cov_5.658709_1_plen_104_part_00
MPEANIVESLRDIDLHGWNELFRTMKAALFPNSARAVFMPIMLMGFSCLIQTCLLLRELQWHHGIGVLLETVQYASQDLQSQARYPSHEDMLADEIYTQSHGH